MLFIVCRSIGCISLVFTIVAPDRYIQALGEVIRKKRSKLGYSQESFAHEVGVHRTYMGSIERGEKNLTIRNLLRVSEALGTLPSKLLKEAENLSCT